MVLRWLATQWLRDSAGRAAREALATRVAHESQCESAEAAPDWNDLPCHAAILFALEIEASGLLEKLRGVKRLQGAEFVAHVGLLGTRRVVVAVTGPGEKRAALATRAIITGHEPRWIIASGFAGGLQERVKRSDLVVADSLLRADGERLATGMSMEAMKGVHVGLLLTIDHIARTTAEKQALGRESGALAVDMETFAIAEVCRTARIRMLAVRAVTDVHDDELPHDIEHLMNQTSTVGRVGAATGAIFRRPGSVKDMWNLREQAIICGDRLADFLPGMIAQLPE